MKHTTLQNVLELRAAGLVLEVTAPKASDLQPGTNPNTDSQFPSVPEFTFFVYDHLGNTRVMYHNDMYDCQPFHTHYVLEHVLDYFPYGRTLREYLLDRERFETTYHERDIESGLDYRGARFYDGDIGRFLSTDPKAMEFAGWSTYNYSLNNPIFFVDPDGKEPEPPSVTKITQSKTIVSFGYTGDRNSTRGVDYVTHVKSVSYQFRDSEGKLLKESTTQLITTSVKIDENGNVGEISVDSSVYTENGKGMIQMPSKSNVCLNETPQEFQEIVSDVSNLKASKGVSPVQVSSEKIAKNKQRVDVGVGVFGSTAAGFPFQSNPLAATVSYTVALGAYMASNEMGKKVNPENNAITVQHGSKSENINREDVNYNDY